MQTFTTFIQTTHLMFRLYLAAMHFNENADREQAVNLEGTAVYKIMYPKSKEGATYSKDSENRAHLWYVLKCDIYYKRFMLQNIIFKYFKHF